MRLHLAGLITEVLPPPPVLSTKVLKEAWVGKKDQLETLDQRPITQFLYTFTPEVKIRSNPVWKRLADLLFTLFERKVASRTLTAVTSDLISSSNSRNRPAKNSSSASAILPSYRQILVHQQTRPEQNR